MGVRHPDGLMARSGTPYVGQAVICLDHRQAALDSAIRPRNGGSVWVCFFRETAFLIAPGAIFGSARLLFFAHIVLFLLFDAAIDLANPSLMLWKLFNNTDPGRDLLIRSGRAAVDASIKGSMDGHVREWPEELTFDV